MHFSTNASLVACSEGSELRVCVLKERCFFSQGTVVDVGQVGRVRGESTH